MLPKASHRAFVILFLACCLTGLASLRLSRQPLSAATFDSSPPEQKPVAYLPYLAGGSLQRTYLPLLLR